MAFPFDLLDLFIPEIAHWMAGKSTSDKRRFLRAGVGLSATGLTGVAVFFLNPSILETIFTKSQIGLLIACAFIFCGVGLLLSLLIDKKIKSAQDLKRQELLNAHKLD
jgi:hypothetical protein